MPNLARKAVKAWIEAESLQRTYDFEPNMSTSQEHAGTLEEEPLQNELQKLSRKLLAPIIYEQQTNTAHGNTVYCKSIPSQNPD